MISLEELRDATAGALQIPDRVRVIGRRYRAADQHERPCRRLDVASSDNSLEQLRGIVQFRGQFADNHGEERLVEGLAIDDERVLYHVVAERLEKLRGIGDCPHAIRLYRTAQHRFGRERDPEPAGGRTHFIQERTLGWRRVIGSADVRAGNRVQQRRAVAHTPGNGVFHGGAAPEFSFGRAGRRSSTRRLQAEHPAAGRRDTD